MLLSLLWSVEVQKSLRGLERQLPFLIMPLAFWMMPKLSRTVFMKILWAFSAGLALMALVLIGYSASLYVQGRTFGVFQYHFLVSPLDLNAIYVSVMVSLSFLFMIFYGKRKLLNYGIIVVLGLFLWLLSSKNIILITSAALFFGVLLRGKYSSKQFMVLITAVAVVGALVLYSPVKRRWNNERHSDFKEALTAQSFGILYPWTGTSLRVFQGRMFYELLQENDTWLTGFGVNAAQDKLAEQQNRYNVYCGYNEYNFHNQYLQTFAELGIFGFLIVCGMLLLLFQNYRKQKELMALFLGLVLFSIFLTETYIWRQRGMIHFLVLFLLLFKIIPSQKTAL